MKARSGVSDPRPSPPAVTELYSALGLTRHATSDEISNAYRALRNKYHPDSKLPGCEPNQEKFKEIGTVYEVLGNDVKRAAYDQGEYNHDLHERWVRYTRDLNGWNARQSARRSVAQKIKRKRDYEFHRYEAARREEEQPAERRSKAAKELRDQKEKEAKELQEKEEREAEEIRAKQQQERRIDPAAANAETPSDSEPEDSLRQQWLEAQKRRRDARKRAAEEDIRAAEGNLKRARENIDRAKRQVEDAEAARDIQPIETAATGDPKPQEKSPEEKANEARIEAKRRAAAERERIVLDKARAERQRAAEMILRANTTPNRPFASKDEEDSTVPADKPKEEISLRIKKLMVREWARRKHTERLEEVGGPGNEHKLINEIIELDFTHVDVVQPCDFCLRIRAVRQYGLWKCPDGGAMICKPCLNRFGTFGG